MTDLHNEDGNGMKGLQAVLDKYLTGDKAMQVIHDWAAMVALDKSIDEGAKLLGFLRESRYQTKTLSSSIYWANPESYSSPGAPPNGSDYVQLRDATGKPLSSSKVRSIQFSSPARHAPAPLEWQSVSVAGDAVLSAGAVDNADRSIVRPVAVPASGDRTLTFDTRYGLETGWDFAFVQVSTDDGLSWTSLANASTTDEHDPAARPADRRPAARLERRRRLARRVVRPLGVLRPDRPAAVPVDDRRRDARKRRADRGRLAGRRRQGRRPARLGRNARRLGHGRAADLRLHAPARQHSVRGTASRRRSFRCR